MALVVGSATVATGMSPVVEAGLYADQIFIDGVTFTSKHDIGSAGQIQVEKYLADNTVAPKTPGSNFSDSEYANSVVDINCNNSFQKSQKVPMYYEATIPTPILINKTDDVTNAVRVGRQKSGLAVLVAGSTVSTDTTTITEDNIKDILIETRATLRKKNAAPNVVICSVDTYSCMLKVAGKEYTPLYNDDVIRVGKIGLWLGMLFIESSALDGTSSYTYKDGDGVDQTVDISDVEFVMYDFNAFSIIDKLTLLRIKDSEKFAGSLIQEEVDTGFKVTNSACALVKKHL